MSCEKCERAKEENGRCFYRWKNANIEIIGCRPHLREVLEALNSVQRVVDERAMALLRDPVNPHPRNPADE